MSPRRTATPATPATDEVNGDAAPAGMNHTTDLAAAALQIFNEDWQSLKLVQKLARIAGHVGTLPKTGYNAFHKYHYIEESALVGALRQYLAAAGILIIPDVVRMTQLRETSENPITELMVRYTVTDGTESFSFSIPGHGADKGDKGVYKALTGSQKYALMKLFKIETGDDPEADTRVDERSVVTARSAPVRVTGGTRGGVQRGAHTTKASPVQIRRIAELRQDLGLERPAFVAILKEQFGTELWLDPENPEAQASVIVDYLRDLSTEDAGKLVAIMVEQLRQRLIAANVEIDDDPGGSDYP